MVTTWLVVTSVVNIYASSVVNPLIKNPKIYSMITSCKFYHHNYFLCNSFNRHLAISAPSHLGPHSDNLRAT